MFTLLIAVLLMLTDIADQHYQLIAAMRTGHIEDVLAVLDQHILADVIVGGSAPQQGAKKTVHD